MDSAMRERVSVLMRNNLLLTLAEGYPHLSRWELLHFWQELCDLIDERAKRIKFNTLT